MASRVSCSALVFQRLFFRTNWSFFGLLLCEALLSSGWQNRRQKSERATDSEARPINSNNRLVGTPLSTRVFPGSWESPLVTVRWRKVALVRHNRRHNGRAVLVMVRYWTWKILKNVNFIQDKSLIRSKPWDDKIIYSRRDHHKSIDSPWNCLMLQ